MSNCYYYDEQHNHCNCYVNENLNELLVENVELQQRITQAYRDESREWREVAEHTQAENAELREFAAYLVKYVDPAGYQDICNIECPASTRCRGKSTCSFPDWALEKAKELGVEEY